MQVKPERKVEMEAWLDLSAIYMKLGSWADSHVCLDKAKSIGLFSPESWHATGWYLHPVSLIFLCLFLEKIVKIKNVEFLCLLACDMLIIYILSPSWFFEFSKNIVEIKHVESLGLFAFPNLKCFHN